MTNRKLLIVEDDTGLQRQLRWAFDSYEVFAAGDRQSALEIAAREKPAVVLLDLGLPPDSDGPTEGLATLEAVLGQVPESKVIMMTGQSERSYAVQAVAKGAYDFYQKPVDADILGLIVERAHTLWTLEDENRRLAGTELAKGIPGFLTTDPATLRMLEGVYEIADSSISVLILGESGTGKELIARGTHELSPGRTGKFVAINCAAIPDQLLESELFGHERGAFTGAVKTTPGKVELANGGTLFLDEVGDLNPVLQAKLLRFLQERVIERVGGRESIAVDVRVISATNQNLLDAIANDKFREDLYYRLGEFIVEISPLRERGEDVQLIAEHLLSEIAREQQRPLRTLREDARAAIAQYSWPGNVRELQNRLRRAAIVAKGKGVTAADLDLDAPEVERSWESLKEAREQAEKRCVQNALAISGGNMTRAAQILKVSRPKLYDLLKQYRLKL